MFNYNFDKKKIVVLSLVFILISISYLNYTINKQSVLETSSDFNKYEENQLSILENEQGSEGDVVIHENIDEEASTATSSIVLPNDDPIVVDSQSSGMNDIIAVSNDTIEDLVFNNSYESNYFLQAKIDVEIERDKTLERFDEVINNELVDEESRKDAVSKKMSLIETINKEKIIESLIKGKGFEDSIVFITDKSVYVTVSNESLIDSDIAKILDIVTRETETPIDNIKIQKK